MRGADRIRAKWCAWRYRKFATFGRGVRVRGRFKLSGPGRIVIGDGVVFERLGTPNVIECVEGGHVTIGSSCYLNGLTVFANEAVTIGEDCIIGDCWVSTSDFHSVELNRRSPGAVTRTGPVTIGRNVWLANRTAVLRGVTVGDDSVVGFGTVVGSDVEWAVVVAGSAPRVLRRL